MSADTKSVDVLAVLAFHARAQECTDYPRLRSFDELECARVAIAELIEAGDCVVKSISVAKLVKPSNKNPNAGFVDMRAWYALQGEVTHLIAALARVQGGAK